MTEQNHLACKHGAQELSIGLISDFHEVPLQLTASGKFLKFGVSTLSEMAFSSAHFPFTTQLQGHVCTFSFYKDTKCVKNTLFCVIILNF